MFVGDKNNMLIFNNKSGRQGCGSALVLPGSDFRKKNLIQEPMREKKFQNRPIYLILYLIKFIIYFFLSLVNKYCKWNLILRESKPYSDRIHNPAKKYVNVSFIVLNGQLSSYAYSFRVRWIKEFSNLNIYITDSCLM